MQEVTIKKDANIKLNDTIKDFLNPKFVFIPIKFGFKIKVKDDEYIYKNDIVAMGRNGKIIYSGVSGKVLGVKEMTYFKDKKIPSVVIENDFKENMKTKKSAKLFINEYTKTEILNLLNDTSISYKGTYLVDKVGKSSDLIVINGVEVEPYFGNKYFILKENMDIILETVDILGTVMGSKEIYIALKNTDATLISTLTNILGTYPNIKLKLVTDAYPNGLEPVLKKKLKIDDAVFFDVQEILSIYHILKRERPVTEQLITVTGDGVTPNQVLRVKTGTLLSEIFINNFDFTTGGVEVYLNGSLHGELVKSFKYVVDSDIDGIFISQKEEKKEEPCLLCGLCSKHCPVGLNPKYVYDHKGNVKPSYKEGCIDCGLCNYLCPANRNLRSSMKKKSEETSV